MQEGSVQFLRSHPSPRVKEGIAACGGLSTTVERT